VRSAEHSGTPPGLKRGDLLAGARTR